MVLKITSFKRFHAYIDALSAPDSAAGHHQPTPLPETPGHSWASLGQSLVGSFLLSPGSWCTQGLVCALKKSVSPVLCKFWWLRGGANGDLLQEGLCHTQVYCTQRPCPRSSPLLAHMSSGDTHTQFCLSLCGVSGSWCAQGMFEPSTHLGQVWGLIPGWGRSPEEGNGNPLLYSCLGNPVERGTWWVTVHGVSKNRT